MPNYKSIRLEELVYNELAKRQLPRESMSRSIARLLNNLDEATFFFKYCPKASKGDKK